MLRNILAGAQYIWARIHMIVLFIIGLLVLITGLVGFISSDKPFEGMFELMIYGPALMLVAVRVLKPEQKVGELDNTYD